MILAPVARDRKGEFVDVFAEMQARGYVRFRVDGQAYEFDDLPKLKKTEKHDIDVVIDRLKVRPDAQQRLAESFEAALRLADGRAIAVEMEQRHRSTGSTPSSPAPSATTRSAELEPRLFSFNSPVGACPSCDGLGHMEFFDPARVVAFPTLSLASGAIKGWDRRNGYYFSLLESLAQALQVRRRRALRGTSRAGAPGGAARLRRGRDPLQLHDGIGQLGRPQGHQEACLRRHHPQHGAALSRNRFGGGARRAGALSQHAALPRMPRHAPAQRSAPREGGRRRPGPRHLRDRPCHAARELRVLRQPEAARRQGRDRRQGDPRDRPSAEIPQRRRPELPQPGSQRRNAVGRRSAAHPPGLADRLGPDRRDVRAGRAQHRPAPARQRPADRHAAPSARHRQQRDRGRARRGHDPCRRPPDRHGAGRGHPRRPRDGAGQLRGREGRARVPDRPVPFGREIHRRAQAPHAVAAGGGRRAGGKKSIALSAQRRGCAPGGARSGTPGHARRRAGDPRARRDRQQPEERQRRLPGRTADLRDGRLGLGQVDAGERHALRGRGAHALPRARGAGRARSGGRHRALRQGHQRRPVADRPHAAQQSRPPTPACSRRSAS